MTLKANEKCVLDIGEILFMSFSATWLALTIREIIIV